MIFQIRIHDSSEQDGSRYTRSEKGKMVIDSNSSRSEDDRESSRVLCFLRNVFKEELGDRFDHDNRKPLLFGLTIRAALLDSGFVETKPVSKTTGNVQRNWCLPTYYYTLSDIISSGKTESIMIKFQHLGRRDCRVYGSVVGGTTVHSVLIDKAGLVLFSSVVWAHRKQVIVVLKASNKATDIQPNEEILRFWREFKDRFVLPLLSDLCEKAGLQGPPCFMGMPDELKVRILRSVCGPDLARVSCVCSGLRRLASSDDLWEHMFTKQYPYISFPEGMGSTTYKEAFASFWSSRKRHQNIANRTRRL